MDYPPLVIYEPLLPYLLGYFLNGIPVVEGGRKPGNKDFAQKSIPGQDVSEDGHIRRGAREILSHRIFDGELVDDEFLTYRELLGVYPDRGDFRSKREVGGIEGDTAVGTTIFL